MSETTETAFQALQRRVQADPELHASLFALDDPADFVGAVRQLAQSLGHELDEATISQAMNSGARAWFERGLP